MDCGLEHRSLLIDYHSEWRKSTDVDKYHDDSTRSTLVSNITGIGSGLITNLPKADAQSGFQIRCNSTEKRWESSFSELEKISDLLSLGNQLVRDRACEILMKSLKFDVQKSIRLQVIQATSVLYAARLEGGNSSRTFKEISYACNIPQKEIYKCFKKIKKVLETSLLQQTKSLEHPVICYSKNFAVYIDLPPEWIQAIELISTRVCLGLYQSFDDLHVKVPIEFGMGEAE
jgi:transcription initiation factor TFIIIB Brf1 subunit/transcription initiation factor TFIIB